MPLYHSYTIIAIIDDCSATIVVRDASGHYRRPISVKVARRSLGSFGSYEGVLEFVLLWSALVQEA